MRVTSVVDYKDKRHYLSSDPVLRALVKQRHCSYWKALEIFVRNSLRTGARHGSLSSR